MAQPTMVKVDPEELQALSWQFEHWISAIESDFNAIDKSLDELAPFWAGQGYSEFGPLANEEREFKDSKVRAIREFYWTALSNAPIDYDKLESSIEEGVRKLLPSG